MAFHGDMTLDATGSSFELGEIVAYETMDPEQTVVATMTGQGTANTLTLSDVAWNSDFTFTLTAPNSGHFALTVVCESDAVCAHTALALVLVTLTNELRHCHTAAQQPTRSPTGEPTANPTIHPTVDPTADPTSGPSSEPTANPTSDPTRDPTTYPTSGPSSDPTVDPTSDPSRHPTSNPTVDPTSDPIAEPTVQPAEVSTFEPSSVERDCAHFAIDEYLDQCSAIFPEAVEDVTASIAGVAATAQAIQDTDLPAVASLSESNTANIAELAETVSAIHDASIPDIESDVTALDARMTTMERRVRSFETSSARTERGQSDQSQTENSDASLYAQYKDELVMALLASNLALMAYAACSRRSREARKYTEVYVSSDRDV